MMMFGRKAKRDDLLNALFRTAVEKQYGAPMADEIFRRGMGKYEHEPYYTAMATRFRDFVAGYEAAEKEVVAALRRSPSIEELTPLPWEWNACISVQDQYDLMKRRLDLAASLIDGGEAVHGQVVQPIRDEPKTITTKEA